MLQHLSGISTLTSKFCEKIEGSKAILLDTRKTTPGLRRLEKYAVACGGAYNHRMDLSSAILIKDNHIAAAGGLKNAEAFTRSIHPKIPVELEVDSIIQIEEAKDIELDGFLLDNMTPEETKACVKLIRKFKDGDSIFIESSGSITLETLPDYVWTGIDAVSIGALTNQANSVDIKLELR